MRQRRWLELIKDWLELIKMKEEETKHFRVDETEILWFKDWLVVPKDREL